MNLAWIPNSLTMGNLLLGFFSVIIAGYNNNMAFIISGFLIMGAALLDGLDGQAARALKVASPLGAELDSLADCVAFGIAPGYLAYRAYFSGVYFDDIIIPFLGRPLDFGIFIAGVFPICAAYRLARFNVNSEPNSFRGLPSPIAGIIIAIVPITYGTYIMNNNINRILFAIFFAVIALLMVSTVRYSKPQSSFFKNITGIKIALLLGILIILIIFFKQWSVLIIMILYILSGLFSFIIQFIQDHRY